MCNFCRTYETMSLTFGDFRYWNAFTEEGKAAVRALRRASEQDGRINGSVQLLELSEFTISDILVSESITIPVFQETCSVSMSFPVGPVINLLSSLLTSPGAIPRFLVYTWFRNEMIWFGRELRGYAIC